MKSNGLFKSCLTRFKSSMVLAGIFYFSLAGGHLSLFILGLFIQIQIYKEIVRIPLEKYAKKGLKSFNNLHWLWFATASFYFYGVPIFKQLIKSKIIPENFLIYLKYHLSVSCWMFIAGLVLFVLSLKKGYYRYQFKILGFCLVSLLLINFQIFLLFKMLDDGFVWVIFPIIINIVNDTSAYFFGKFFGKTKLTNLSPKKTLEGYIGAAVFTVFSSFLISYIISQYKFLICPSEGLVLKLPNCNAREIFFFKERIIPWENLSSYLPIFAQNFFKNHINRIFLSDFQIHCFYISIWQAVLTPFGGFFASGFKRAFNLKDFGNLIPGHGGLTDRLDCLPLSSIIVYAYKQAFVNKSEMDYNTIFNYFLKLPAEEQKILGEKIVQFLKLRE